MRTRKLSSGESSRLGGGEGGYNIAWETSAGRYESRAPVFNFKTWANLEYFRSRTFLDFGKQIEIVIDL